MCIMCLADCIVYLIDLLYVYYMCNLCSEYLYVMLCYAVRCLVLRISVPSLTQCCSVHLTNEILELDILHIYTTKVCSSSSVDCACA